MLQISLLHQGNLWCHMHLPKISSSMQDCLSLIVGSSNRKCQALNDLIWYLNAGAVVQISHSEQTLCENNCAVQKLLHGARLVAILICAMHVVWDSQANWEAGSIHHCPQSHLSADPYSKLIPYQLHPQPRSCLNLFLCPKQQACQLPWKDKRAKQSLISSFHWAALEPCLQCSR